MTLARDPQQLVYDFQLDLSRFGDEVEDGALKVFHESAQQVAEAIVVGNQYGPGVAVDTGFARSSFRIGVNAPVDGPSVRPFISRRVTRPGVERFPAALDLAPIGAAQLGDVVYITTQVNYAQHLEFEAKRRRFGPYKGRSTAFIDPVEARFDTIVDDAADRVGYGVSE